MDKQINIFAENVEGQALDQFYSAMKMDFSVAGALMPDVHTGYSLPIGGVVATRGVVVPAWVGYDIGCGMCAVPTDFDISSVREHARAIFDEIRARVPLGFEHRKEMAVWKEYDQIEKTATMEKIFMDKDGTGFKQLGTLGGGNHFIEVGAGDDGRIWVIIHSGSRNIGHRTGTHYMRLAGGGKAREGHYALDVSSKEGGDYWFDMNFCLEFALENRRQMLHGIERAMRGVLGRGDFIWDELVNRNHNHATLREFNGEDVIIHRKGATHAEEGMYGVIPGNMRDGSFIVRGLGNPASLYSSSHGAGRVLGRKAAKEKLSVDKFRTTMKGIVATTNKSTLDESPMAYKDIFEVMELQKDLVEVVCHVKPILNVKG